MRRVSCRTVTIVALMLAAGPAVLQAQVHQSIRLDLPVQPLADSLRAVGLASNTNIVFDPRLVAGITAPAFSGMVTAEEALEQLLAGTRVRFKFVDEKTVSLMPARATGKSLYIAVLVKQLELLCERLGVSMEPATRATAQAYEANYETPLFVQRGLIPPTPTMHTQASSQREPLVFSIGGWHGIRRFLVLRDVAGEDMESGDLHTPPFRFFANADAVFFMFDPLRVQTIRDQLRDLLPAQQFSGGDPRSVLNNLLMAVGQGQPKLAVILSKFDALRTLRNVEGSEWSMIMSNTGAAYLRDTSDSPRYDELGGQLLHEEVRSLLTRLHGGAIVAAVENPSTGIVLPHRYFVVSALGQPPSGNKLHSRGIAPFRCADPIRWVTSGFGVL